MVRQRSAKPLFTGSNPVAASNPNTEVGRKLSTFFILPGTRTFVFTLVKL